MPEAAVISQTQTPPPPPAAPATEAPAAGVTTAQNTAEQAPATLEGGEKKPDTEQAPEKRQGQSRYERRLDRAYRKAAEAQARAEFFEKQYNEARAKVATPEDPGAPKLENFKDIEEYAKAVGKYESEKALKAHQDKQRSETQKQMRTRLTESWEAKAARADGKYEDFDEVVGDIQPTSPWSIAVMEAENGEDIAYYLGKNMKEAHRIAALPPTAQIREIGKLEAKLAAEPPKPKTASKAPPPITPLAGTTPAENAKPSDKDDIDTWFKKRNAEVRAKRRR